MKEASTGSKDSHEFFKIKLKVNPVILKFIVFFIISLSIFYLISIQFESYIPLFSMQSTAKTLHFLLNLLGIKNNLDAYSINFSNFSIEVVRQCTGIFEVMALTACMLAYPAPKEKKFAGIVFAIPVIYVFNMFRLILLSILGIYYPSVFEAVHDYLLQLTFVFLVIFFWMFWINKVVKKEGEKNEKR
jgi:archaeosortase B (VPXXXP-CTERM-specific)